MRVGSESSQLAIKASYLGDPCLHVLEAFLSSSTCVIAARRLWKAPLCIVSDVLISLSHDEKRWCGLSLSLTVRLVKDCEMIANIGIITVAIISCTSNLLCYWYIRKTFEDNSLYSTLRTECLTVGISILGHLFLWAESRDTYVCTIGATMLWNTWMCFVTSNFLISLLR